MSVAVETARRRRDTRCRDRDGSRHHRDSIERPTWRPRASHVTGLRRAA